MRLFPSAPAGEFWTTRRFLLVQAAVLFAIFPKVILGLTTFYFQDAGVLGYPIAYYIKQTIGHGELPLWDAYSHCGVPWLAQMGAWYPLNGMFVVLPLPWAANMYVLGHLMLAGWGMYALTRRWGVGGFAASFAGLAYIFSGVSLSCFQWGNYIASLCWLPWVALTATEAWRRGGRWIAFAVIVSALQVLTATPELTLMGWMLIGAIWLTELFSGETKFWNSSRRLAVVVLLAAGLTMVQMLPFMDLLAHSQRGSGFQSSRWAMPGWGWANLVVPLFHGYLSPRGNWFQHGQDFLLSYYPGLGVMALALAGIWCARTRTNLVIAATILIFWALALGNAGHLYPLAKKMFPWIGIARYPVKFVIPTAFLLPLLAAWAVQKIQASPGRPIRRSLVASGGFFLVLAALLVVFARQYPFPSDETAAMTLNAAERVVLLAALIGVLLWLAQIKTPGKRLAVQFLALGILLADLLTHSPGITPTLPSSVLAPGFWQADGRPSLVLGEGRIMDTPAAEQQMRYSVVRDPQADFLGKRLAEWDNLNLLDSLPKVNGAITLRPAKYDLVEHWIYFTIGTQYGEGLQDFLSAAWTSDPANPAKWIARPNYLPVMTAGQRPEFKTDREALAAICATNFNPRAVVYLPADAREFVTVSNQTECQIKHVQFRQTEVSAEVTAVAPSLVVLSQAYYHLWQASVDGRRVPLLRANVGFQALQVPAGAHQIKLVYRDLNQLVGAAISLAALLICILIFWRCRVEQNGSVSA